MLRSQTTASLPAGEAEVLTTSQVACLGQCSPRFHSMSRWHLHCGPAGFHAVPQVPTVTYLLILVSFCCHLSFSRLPVKIQPMNKNLHQVLGITSIFQQLQPATIQRANFNGPFLPGLSGPTQHFKDLHRARVELREVHRGAAVRGALQIVRPGHQQGPKLVTPRGPNSPSKK